MILIHTGLENVILLEKLPCYMGGELCEACDEGKVGQEDD